MSLNEIKNQFGKVIEVSCSDNAKEYSSIKFTSFLSAQGIWHESTCPHTQLQNGIVERKNKHLIKTTHSLMLNKYVRVHHLGNENYMIFNK